MHFLDDKERKLRLEYLQKGIDLYQIAIDLFSNETERILLEAERLKKDLEFLDKQNLELMKKIDRREGEIKELEQNLRLQKEYNKQVIDPDCMLTIN